MRIFLVLLILVLLGVSIWGLFFAPEVYSGKEVFQTEQEYTSFKEALAYDEVKIIKSYSLTSAPPIVISFTITSSRDYSFPYGHKSSSNTIVGSLGIIASIGLLLFVAIPSKFWDN